VAHNDSLLNTQSVQQPLCKPRRALDSTHVINHAASRNHSSHTSTEQLGMQDSQPQTCLCN
jgi:hypothetical protein